MSTQEISKILILIILFASIVSAVRINEVMPDPADSCSDCSEWIELQSEVPTNLTNWTIDTNGQKTNFSYYLIDFLIITGNKSIFLNYWNVNESKIIEWKSIGLTNSGDVVKLFNNSESISDFNYSSSHTNKSWQFYNNLWQECAPTPGITNNCTAYQNSTNPTNTINSTGNSNSTAPNLGIYLQLDWHEEEIINGDEFNIELKAFNLKDKDYDIKISVMHEGDTLSEIYDDNEGEWQSSYDYISKAIREKGNYTEKFQMRIKEKYKNFSGNAEISAKIRETSSENLKNSTIKEIKIIAKEAEDNASSISELTNNNSTATDKETAESEEEIKVIKLAAKSIKSYKSKSEYIKEYSIYGFALFCIVIMGMLIWKKLRR